MHPLADWVVHCGAEVVKAIALMQKRGVGAEGERKLLGPNVFRKLEAIYVPDDFHKLLLAMTNEAIPQNAARLNSEATKIIRARWWTWLLLHPGLDAKYIHADRSMPPVLTLLRPLPPFAVVHIAVVLSLIPFRGCPL